MHVLAQYLQHLTIRTANDSDQEFLKRLYASTRDDLRQISADSAFIESLIAMQQNMQTVGYRNAYPDAEYLMLERHGEAIGRIVINISNGEMRLIDISFMPQARGKRFGTAVLHALQQSAVEKKLPLKLSVYRNNPDARRFYVSLGFQPESSNEMAEQMIWEGWDEAARVGA